MVDKTMEDHIKNIETVVNTNNGLLGQILTLIQSIAAPDLSSLATGTDVAAVGTAVSGVIAQVTALQVSADAILAQETDTAEVVGSDPAVTAQPVDANGNPIPTPDAAA